jgi:molybdopterin-guanine dinucleotide biosynthesis protein A
LTGAILAGGENTRIPKLKGFLEVGGTPIITHNIGILKKIFERVVISTNMPERYFSLGLSLIGDIRSERGPMTGILSVLVATGDDSVFVVACDMPFVNEHLIRYMVEKHREESAGGGVQTYDAVVPVFQGLTEPLFGIYTRDCIPTLESMIRNGQRSIIGMLKALRVRPITDDEVKGVDAAGRSFVNINTVEDYKKIGGKVCLG